MANGQKGLIVKGIVLAGGSGSRLDPITRGVSKQLQAVYDKPMIYYPLATLMGAGIRDILIISTPDDLPLFRKLLGDGSQWGVQLAFAEQREPLGIAQAFLIGAEFIHGQSVALILGDNIFHGEFGLQRAVEHFESGAMIFGYPVNDPGRYGVVTIDAEGKPTSIEEKPNSPTSNLAIPGLYLYDGGVSDIASTLRPSERGELEISDVNRHYLENGKLVVRILNRGVAWLDSGTHDSLLDAANFIATIEHRQGLKIACLEEIALERGFISIAHLETITDAMPRSGYREYIERVLLGRHHAP
ncbi:MAG: glucose-1-phosphate thymidylyltransferase RfbA [Acidimicrobiia bacterium]